MSFFSRFFTCCDLKLRFVIVIFWTIFFKSSHCKTAQQLSIILFHHTFWWWECSINTTTSISNINFLLLTYWIKSVSSKIKTSISGKNKYFMNDKVFELGLRWSFSSIYIIGLYFVYSKLIYCIPFQLLVLRTTLYNSRKSVSSRIFVWKDCLHLKSFIFIASVWSRVWSAEVHKKARKLGRISFLKS